jgi:SAM-dependent MidA family methyltransferase
LGAIAEGAFFRGGQRLSSAATPLAAILAERIRRFGPITFAEFMREALYHPLHGYYTKAETIRFADYYTSVDVHAIFGRLLVRQFCEMWKQMDCPALFTVVEAGAGVGRLAGQILGFARLKLPEFYAAIRYVAVERSPSRSDQLAARLAQFVREGKCAASIEIPAKISAGCAFSNELLDAMAVHRVRQTAGGLQEIFVGHEGGDFVELDRPLSTCAISEYFGAQEVTLQQGQQAEAGLEACDWIMEIGRRLERGFVLTIDYGHEAADLYDEHHMLGTMLAYTGHEAKENYYAAAGQQDLTAHVNFTALRLWGERVGLHTLGMVSQTAFLLALGKGNEFEDLYDEGMDETDRVRARLQLKTLIYPEGMGERFQVLLQEKGVPKAKMTGLAGI